MNRSLDLFIRTVRRAAFGVIKDTELDVTRASRCITEINREVNIPFTPGQRAAALASLKTTITETEIIAAAARQLAEKLQLSDTKNHD